MSSTMHMHGGIGESIKRKEDARFLRGKGNYLDDFVLPNMLHMAILRSPHAHARIKSIDTAAASECERIPMRTNAANATTSTTSVSRACDEPSVIRRIAS